MKHAGINMESVKKQNRSSILNYICAVGPVSRKDIADATGLTAAAVTLICNDFIQQNLLYEIGQITDSQRAGRRKVLVDINYNYAYIFAVNIEQIQTTIALTNLKGDVLEIARLSTDSIPDNMLVKIANECRNIINNHSKLAKNIAGVSVAISGIVDKNKGASVHAYGIWDKSVDVCSKLKELLGYPVIIENNVNAFALAEIMFGLGRDDDNLLLIKWGPGVGSTIIIDHAVYEGRNGKAAELGHFIVDKNGDKCSCGRIGCLETKVSHHALCKKAEFELNAFGDAYRKAKATNDTMLYDEAIDLFARSIVNTITILAPNHVVLYGSLFNDEEIRNILISKCMEYDSKCNHDRIIYSTLASKEDYIGPVATFIYNELF